MKSGGVSWYREKGGRMKDCGGVELRSRQPANVTWGGGQPSIADEVLGRQCKAASIQIVGQEKYRSSANFLLEDPRLYIAYSAPGHFSSALGDMAAQ